MYCKNTINLLIIFLTFESKYFIFFHLSSSIVREEGGRELFLSEDLSMTLSSPTEPLNESSCYYWFNIKKVRINYVNF